MLGEMSLFITIPNNSPTHDALNFNPSVTAKSQSPWFVFVTPPSVQQAYTNHANQAKAAQEVHLDGAESTKEH